ncbi:MAG TPA: serine/threonine-protein kinase [Actinomycetota bacterium]|nr:serine/threonine-protein kinase [Actinomycetota bacterium]
MQEGDLVQERYRLDSPLGRGGMAAVWRAMDERLERPVAIKFLAPQFKEDPEFLVRFFAEAQSVAKISHPNVVAVLDFGEFEDNPYLVMEYASGGSMKELVGDPLELELAGRAVRDAALGAGAAHALGITHRDIKPGNILITDDGMAKLADFGIALTAVSEKLTATGQVIGSPHYIAPEQAAGRGARAESDVYALGVVMYELLTGKPPFDADNATAIAIAHVDQEPEPPSSHVESIPPEVDALVLRCLGKKPAARFRNGNELAAALEEVFPSLEPGVMGGAVASVPVAGTEAATVAGTTVDDEITSEREVVVATPGPRRQRSVLVVGGLIALAVLAGAAVWASAQEDDEPTVKPPVAEETDNEGTDDEELTKRRRTPSPTESDQEGNVPVGTTPTPAPARDDPPEEAEDPPDDDDDSDGGGPVIVGGGGGGGGNGGGGGGGGSPPPEPTPSSEPSDSPEPTPSG